VRAWVLALLFAAGCSKPSAPDAGSIRIHRSTDLRTAVIESYPEFRGARVNRALATMTRVLDRPVPLAEAAELIRKNEFLVDTDGGRLTATRKPFTLQIDGATLKLSMPLADAEITRMVSSPSTLTTEQLVLWFPKVAGARVIAEQFRLELDYEASVSRAGYIAWQVVDLNTQGSWRVTRWPEGYEQKRRPDGGGGGTPDEYEVSMVDSNTSARIDLHRHGAFVELAYELRTEELH
jgi:hypothetical protein